MRCAACGEAAAPRTYCEDVLGPEMIHLVFRNSWTIYTVIRREQRRLCNAADLQSFPRSKQLSSIV